MYILCVCVFSRLWSMSCFMHLVSRKIFSTPGETVPPLLKVLNTFHIFVPLYHFLNVFYKKLLDRFTWWSFSVIYPNVNEFKESLGQMNLLQFNLVRTLTILNKLTHTETQHSSLMNGTVEMSSLKLYFTSHLHSYFHNSAKSAQNFKKA